MITEVVFKKITPGLFRLLLALLVMVYHSVDFLTVGHYAVYVFFMLSGYWIFRMYNEKYRKFRNAYFIYLVSRLSRLMPVYWLILIFSIIVYISVPALRNSASVHGRWDMMAGAHNFFILGLANSAYPLIGTTWSLDVEVQFYILAPLLLLACQKGNGILILLLSSLIGVFLVYYRQDDFKILLYLPYFIAGGLIYQYKYIASQRLAMISLLLLAGILVINYIIPGLRNGYLLNREAYLFGFNYREGSNVILALLTIPFVSINVRQKVTKEQEKRDQLWSSMSYVIYLLHWPLLQLYAVNVQGAGIIRKSAFLALFFICCVSLSYFISKYIDAYFETKRRYWINGFPKKPVLEMSGA